MHIASPPFRMAFCTIMYIRGKKGNRLLRFYLEAIISKMSGFYKVMILSKDDCFVFEGYSLFIDNDLNNMDVRGNKKKFIYWLSWPSSLFQTLFRKRDVCALFQLSFLRLTFFRSL